MHIDKQALESSFYLFCFWVYCDGWLVGPMMGGWTNRVCEVSLVGRAGGQADGADGVYGRAMPGPRSWMAFVGADTQSGQINFTARRNNVIGGVRLEMSA